MGVILVDSEGKLYSREFDKKLEHGNEIVGQSYKGGVDAFFRRPRAPQVRPREQGVKPFGGNPKCVARGNF